MRVTLTVRDESSPGRVAGTFTLCDVPSPITLRDLRVATTVAKRPGGCWETGKSLRQIAADLNADGTATAHDGAQWWPSTVRAVLRHKATD